MDSINKHHMRQRICTIYDLAHGTQLGGKEIKEYVKGLSKAVGIEAESKGTAQDFLREIGSI